MTRGANGGDFTANGWTIRREPCPFTSASRVNGAGASAAPLFAPAPSNLRVLIVGNTVRLDWVQPPSASASQLEAGTGPGLSDIAVFRTTASTLTVTGVPTGTYYVRVRSALSDFSDLSIPSNEIVVSVVGCGTAADLAPPTGFSASVMGNQVVLSWTAPGSGPAPAATSYLLEVGSAPGLKNLLVFDTGTPATSLQALAPDGTYYVRVYARTPCGTSTASNELTVVVPPVAPLPAPPVAEFSFGRYAKGFTCSYQGCLFDATMSTGTGLTYSWDFADGTTGTGVLVLHVYQRPDVFRQMTVVLTVTDTYGRTSTKAKNLYLDPNY